ncbi:agamous-like MADS-box protein AGL80 [Vicia villosa]|uniref:agamous-like MADS-box protein AGL80 n=1 Tax=Vicia villosa TaxID=3911 RepID=UPI00273B2B69|nr:agamous-like MADS-box protein AGL80 [Vicia villosa]
MGRTKVKLAFIVNDAARKSTYKKRKNGLLKKVDELSTLCGIEACAIIFGPYDPQPEIWPSPLGVQKVLSKFMTVPEFEKNKKMVNPEIFLKQRVMKVKEKLNKQRRENWEKEMTMLLFQCLNAAKIVDNNIAETDLKNLSWMIEKNLKHICRRLEGEDSCNINSQVQLEMAALPPPTTSQNETLEMNNADTITMNDHGEEAIVFGNDAQIQNEFWSNLLP